MANWSRRSRHRRALATLLRQQAHHSCPRRETHTPNGQNAGFGFGYQQFENRLERPSVVVTAQTGRAENVLRERVELQLV